MIIDAYMCPKCLEPQEFKAEERNQPHICPKCGGEMEFWITENINPITGKVDNESYNVMSDTSRVTTITSSANKNVPKCPTCGSTSVEKISLTQKAVGGALFGLFSSNVRNTMHCKNCGYKW